MLTANQIRYLQVEATNRCNAWCPGCHRNRGGYLLEENITVTDLDVGRYQQLLNKFTELDTIDFCGTYGDAIAAKNIQELIDLSLAHCKKLVVRTNGSLRTEQWWTDLAKKLKNINHEVWFCLDGLKDTHSIYRQATDWQKIIDNAVSFINAGGTAVWQFIPWQHNEHQILDCIKLSQQLGFKRFELIKSVRTDFRGYTPRHYQTGQEIKIVPWKHNSQFNRYTKNNCTVTKQNCRHLTDPGVYINANGTVSACCFFQMDRNSAEFEQLPDIELELNQNPNPRCLEQCGVPNS